MQLVNFISCINIHRLTNTVGTGGSLSLKRLGLQADHSPLSGAEIKKALIYTSITPIYLHGVVLSQAQRQLHFYLMYWIVHEVLLFSFVYLTLVIFTDYIASNLK
jgi:hypothetical protein